MRRPIVQPRRRRKNKPEIEYRRECRLWKSLGGLVLFVGVKYPVKGYLILMSTDVSLNPLEVIRFYGYRFWMKGITPCRRGSGVRNLHRQSSEYRERVERKVESNQRYMPCGTIARKSRVRFAVGFRTQNRSQCPSERMTSMALRFSLWEFPWIAPPELERQKILAKNLDVTKVPDFRPLSRNYALNVCRIWDSPVKLL